MTKTVTLDKVEYDILIEAYYELCDIVLSAPDLDPCWVVVSDYDELVEPIITKVEQQLGGKA